MHKIKYLIIGAGVTGLTFANYMNNDNYLILEKENDPGGYCRTIYKDNYIWDYSGHFFHFKNDEIKKYFFEHIGKKNIISKNKNTKIFYKGKLVDYPFQSNIHELNKPEFIDCLYDFTKREKSRYYNSFEEMLYGKYGKSITEKFLKPYNEKQYACSLKDLDQNAMGRFFPNTDLQEIINNMREKKDNSYNKEFFYPKMGANAFINALLDNISNNKIIYNEEMIKIDIKNKIVYTKTNSYRYETLVNTGSFKNLVDRIGIKKYSENILSSNKVIVYNLGFDKKSRYNNIHWLYIPNKKYWFYRVGFYDNILDSDKMSIYVEIGLRSDEKINKESKLDEVITELREVGIIDDQKLISYSIIEMNPAYVHINRNSNIYVKKMKKKLRENDIYSIGRYGSWKYCSIEDSMLEAIDAANEVKNAR